MNNTDVDLFFDAFIEIGVHPSYCKKKLTWHAALASKVKLLYPDVLSVCLCKYV